MQLRWSPDVPVPTDFGLNHEDLNLHTPDGITLRSYLLRQRKVLDHHQAGNVEIGDSQTDEEVSGEICVQSRLYSSVVQFAATRPTVLMFHGNGGNHGHRIPLAKVFYIKMRCNVLMLSYRG